MTTEVLTPAEKRRRNQEGKANTRRAILSSLPKGGVCIEVGVWRGEFTRMILNQLVPEKLYLVDPWKNFDDRSAAFDGATKDQEFEAIYSSVCDKYAPEIERGQVEVKRDLSSKVLGKMKAISVDFIYLDGDHSYEGVKADLKHSFRVLKVGGIVMLDDYHRRGWWGDGVVRAANEFLGEYPTELRIRVMKGAQLAIEKIKPL